MFHTLTSKRFHGVDPHTAKHGLPRVMHLLRLTLITGPKVLVTSRISGKCAAIMLMLCTPSLLFCSILTIPGMLFQSPQQQAYFYFAKMLDQDPGRWIVLVLAGLCSLISLAVPATMPAPPTEAPSYY